MRYIYLALFLLFAVSTNAAQYDTTYEVRDIVYDLLGLHASGLTTPAFETVDQHITDAIQRVNIDCSAYRKRDKLAMVAGQRLYAVDSLVGIIGAVYVTNDSLIILTPLDIDTLSRTNIPVYMGDDEAKYRYPKFIVKWEDSVWLIPTPIRADDTVIVHYVHLIPPDSIRLLPVRYRLGVVYYAAMLAAVDIGNARAEYFRQLYDAFVLKNTLIPFLRKDEE